MRAYVPAYSLQRPPSLEATLELLQAHPGRFRPLAGGTDLMVVYNAGKLPPCEFLDISRLPELQGIEANNQELTLGALTTYSTVLRHPLIQAEYPNLAAAAFCTGAVAIQNRGTLGGNIANASPAADSPPALLVYGAQIELISVRGRRRVDYADFHLDYKKTAMAADELIARIVLPRATGARFHFYRKVGTRKAQAISKVCLAACADGSGIRLGWGAVAPVPALSPKTAELLRGLGQQPLNDSVRSMLQSEISPIDDIRSNRDYRRRVAENLLEQCWSEYLQWSPT